MTMTLSKLEFSQGDRLRKSLQASGISVTQMAAALGVRRETVSGWINDRHAPSWAALQVWAQKTEVPLSWLENGTLGDVRPEGFEPPAYWSVADEFCPLCGSRLWKGECWRQHRSDALEVDLAFWAQVEPVTPVLGR